MLDDEIHFQKGNYLISLYFKSIYSENIAQSFHPWVSVHVYYVLTCCVCCEMERGKHADNLLVEWAR